ncbi:MAG: 4-hydroxy-3-methylbut-2-enyl diphosphate reductase [Dysgonamonadaceae bacterium]|jgi:4-hydroxy-3-methylbut-2-enyl diphosphate reductase|nr:4-hydroxy-3-methylbut-2-enyl diphosphate reductase [Dysgonamonadaceae bacterium]
MFHVDIDQGSGFCFGVVNAINSAERELHKGKLYCLGDIVHNSQEVERLRSIGLEAIDYEQFNRLKNAKVLLRAHGEPPETYLTAKQNNIEIIDATCPVVLQLQRKILRQYSTSDAQIVIYGKSGHAEVNGLVGQTAGQAIVIENKADLHLLDFNKDICLFSQTTKSLDEFEEIVEIIRSRIAYGVNFSYFDTICRQVANRIPHIREFACKHDLVLFVAGKKSSNGIALFKECEKANKNSHLISGTEDICTAWFAGISSVGVCGATSTPKWQMEAVVKYVKSLQ